MPNALLHFGVDSLDCAGGSREIAKAKQDRSFRQAPGLAIFALMIRASHSIMSLRDIVKLLAGIVPALLLAGACSEKSPYRVAKERREQFLSTYLENHPGYVSLDQRSPEFRWSFQFQEALIGKTVVLYRARLSDIRLIDGRYQAWLTGDGGGQDILLLADVDDAQKTLFTKIDEKDRSALPNWMNGGLLIAAHIEKATISDPIMSISGDSDAGENGSWIVLSEHLEQVKFLILKGVLVEAKSLSDS